MLSPAQEGSMLRDYPRLAREWGNIAFETVFYDRISQACQGYHQGLVSQDASLCAAHDAAEAIQAAQASAARDPQAVPA